MNASEKTYQQLKAKIISNELAGAVSESELCAAFNVSRTPLREAIFRLITEGWIDYSKNKTKTIRPITLKELKNIFQIRADIEMMLLNLSWKHHDISIYQTIKQNIEQGLDRQDVDLLLTSDNQLHQQLLDDCKNDLVYKMLSFIYDRLRMLRSDKMKSDSVFESSAEHLNICDAIIIRDQDAARKAIFEHVSNSRLRILSSFDE